ncbi:MAG: hypothetical protein P8J87_20225 [Verrucomicrobiales bacterium]|nr:hypothetical protein [Verrucomicrobiales bacterium]
MLKGRKTITALVLAVLMPAVAGGQEVAEVVEIGQEQEQEQEQEVTDGLVPPARVFSGPVKRTVSSSKQFHIYADTQRLRAAFAVYAEEVKRDYLRMLKAKDDWGYPIVVRVVADRIGSGREAVRSRTEEVVGAGFRFVIRAELTRDFSREGLREELVRMLMAEHVLRGYESAPANSGVLVPAWLHAGVLEAMSYRKVGRASDVFASIMDRGLMMAVEDLLRGNPARMDSLTEAMWRASSGALVMTLLGQPSGAERFQGMIGRMAVDGGDVDFLLRKSFPGFRASRNGIEKWWALQVATMAQPTVFDLFGPEESEALLVEALQIYYPEEELSAEGTPGEASGAPDGEAVALPAEISVANGWQKCDIADFGKVIARGDVALLVRRNRLALLNLELRAFQLVRPIVAQYREIVGQIAEGKTKGLGERLRLLAAQRADLLADAKAVEDYMNWFEATQMTQWSDGFDRYFDVVRKLEASRPKRLNPISRALDEVERELE